MDISPLPTSTPSDDSNNTADSSSPGNPSKGVWTTEASQRPTLQIESTLSFGTDLSRRSLLSPDVSTESTNEAVLAGGLAAESQRSSRLLASAATLTQRTHSEHSPLGHQRNGGANSAGSAGSDGGGEGKRRHGHRRILVMGLPASGATVVAYVLGQVSATPLSPPRNERIRNKNLYVHWYEGHAMPFFGAATKPIAIAPPSNVGNN